MNQNLCMFVGRVASKPQLKPYKRADGTEGYRCFFRLAVTRLMDRGKKREDNPRCNFIPIVTWGDAAKRHAQYLDKGTEVTIFGELIVDSQPKADGSFGPDMWNIQARDVQYGQASLKNMSAEQVNARRTALDTRGAEIAAGTNGTATPSATPTATEPASGNPFTTDGQAPEAASA